MLFAKEPLTHHTLSHHRDALSRKGRGQRFEQPRLWLGRHTHATLCSKSEHHLGSRPAAFTTAAHLSMSAARRAPSSASLLALASVPRSTRRPRKSGIATTFRTSMLSVATVSFGVCAGATSAFQPTTSAATPLSRKV